jgi:hypothetical protein
MGKRIEVIEMKVGDIGTKFGNPRKINKKKIEELEHSLETLGNFGVFVIDENNDIIAGNQRCAILKKIDPDTVVLCKRLIGYSEAEKRAINIKDNVHAGEWDLDILADWTADLNMDVGKDNEQSPYDREIKEMELLRFEKYNYVMIVCRNEIDYNLLVRKLGIEGAKVRMTKTRKIQARAIWFDDMKAQIVSKAEETDIK